MPENVATESDSQGGPRTSANATNGAATPDHAGWIRAIAAELIGSGAVATVNGDQTTGLDVTVAAQPPGRDEADVMLDEDGFAEIRWKADRGVSPAAMAAALTRMLAAVVADPAVLAPDRPTP